ncbi:MAG: COX15/CtaA family protein [Acidobacteriota bacterium]|nr:MAG: COX15/CtaA family protein [Acidobacteriota bacterium]
MFLGYVLAVISWGAYVRATGSGAGCGSHWPLCNGEIVPRSEQLETLIEFTHRATSGLALIGSLVLVIWAFRCYARGSQVRNFAALSLFFMLTEALLGAGLVLFGLVARDDSIARAWVMAFHLINTFLLLACLTLTAWWASGRTEPRFAFQKPIVVGCVAALLAQLLLGASGAIAALGDTLFPPESLAGAIQQDFSADAHILLQLRVYHPIIAGLVALLVVTTAAFLARRRSDRMTTALAMTLGLLFLLQLGVGIVNLLLLAPVGLQLLHLFVADLVWITTIVMAATAVEERRAAPEAR